MKHKKNFLEEDEEENITTTSTQPPFNKYDTMCIIGAGPVGSLQAVILLTLFPQAHIFVLDKRATHVRNHGLKIWNTTMADIIQHLHKVKQGILAKYQKHDNHSTMTTTTTSLFTTSSSMPKKKKPASISKLSACDDDSPVHSKQDKHLLGNIEETCNFLENNFTSMVSGPFIKTKVISIKLLDYAAVLGKKNQQVYSAAGFDCCLGPEYEITETMLKNVQQPACDTSTKGEVILKQANIVFGADGSHSTVRKIIFGEADPEKDTIQHLIEIKLAVTHVEPDAAPKQPSTLSSLFSWFKSDSPDVSNSISEIALAAQDFIEKSIFPTLSNGKIYVWNVSKDHVATLHILIKQDLFDELRAVKNEKNEEYGTYQNPFTSVQQLPPKSQSKRIIKEALENTIGTGCYVEDSVRISTIPMLVYKAKQIVTVAHDKLFCLVGDAAVGLIFIRGVNNGLQCTSMYGESLWRASQTDKNDALAFLQATEKNIFKLADDKIVEIKNEKALLDSVVSVINTTHSVKTSIKKKKDSKTVTE